MHNACNLLYICKCNICGGFVTIGNTKQEEKTLKGVEPPPRNF